jgi:hypothetical protein
MRFYMMKKSYARPKLSVHGDIARITLQGGSSRTDVPMGTPVGPSGVSSVAS